VRRDRSDGRRSSPPARCRRAPRRTAHAQKPLHKAAEPQAARAAAELAASGEQARRRDSSRVRDLTPHELQLPLLVSQGATNKEASAALFISPKTVEAHLHRIYVKLGLRSRTELAHHLVQVGLNVGVGELL
jgi:DNA-binding NarL/FixJ family response regulator